jgi:hypothetical protein
LTLRASRVALLEQFTLPPGWIVDVDPVSLL